MRLLLDENVPKPLYQALATFILNHEIEGFHVVVTNDGRQMQRPREVAAIAASGLHRTEYPHKHHGLAGMGIAIATVAAGLPGALAVLQEANGQRLIALRGIDPTSKARLHVIDPLVDPPKFWVSFSPD
ncbi:hypothetical protein SAMN05421833_10422 [Microbispora rosea]|uniref:VapC45 PIN like domain-containing protein n=1 Tax=Microbispora rosea TaxID=58117 RepID=A0A1N6VZ72_9ACTN|nr:hypothetical protein [Microbispora rosea]GIH51286.1 hypothetical protein Mro03_64650 [Microbispora rosea subsp. rosea]SIQ83068.1 hypothetical protein SAMN05421833_10422 [Microbispora rosea]